MKAWVGLPGGGGNFDKRNVVIIESMGRKEFLNPNVVEFLNPTKRVSESDEKSF